MIPFWAAASGASLAGNIGTTHAEPAPSSFVVAQSSALPELLPRVLWV
jgi:hypothetical protein